MDAHPLPRVRRIALRALALLFIPNIALPVNPMAAEVLSATVPGVLVLMLARLPPAAAALGVASVLTRTEQHP